MRAPAIAFLLLPLLPAGGCTQKRTYEVIVHNRLEKPITVGLIKEGPPFDPKWATVEQWAMGAPLDTMPAWGGIVPPARTVDTTQEGSFARGANAYLRVYNGEYSNAHLLAIGATSPDRLDVTLLPGRNEIEIVHEGQKPLVAKRLRPSQ